MPLEKIIIKVSGETDLASTISQLEKIGVVDASNASQFKKNNTEQKGLINGLVQRIEALAAARNRSDNPVAIQRYNALIKDSTKQIEKLTGATNDLAKATKKTQGIFDDIGKTMIAAFSVAAVVELGKKIIEVTSQFQKLEAVLTNTLGSKSKAQDALAMIQQFAAETNFSVLELTNAYVKLVNQGFTPTKDEMRKLADLANSTGKSFDQLTEAILDAQTGQFERLKEFGIKASKEGDKVTFTFKGVKTQVDYTSEAMKNYILSLGDLQGVSGSTAAISETLGGKISNLGDAFDKLFATLGESGSGTLKGFIGILTDFVNSLGESISFISNPIEYARKAAKEEYEKAVDDMKAFYKDKDSFERQVEIQSVANAAKNTKNLTDAQLYNLRIRLSALALLEQEAREKEAKALEMADANKKGLIKTLSEELKSLKQQEEDALTEVEIRAIQKREAQVKAELDRLHGVESNEEKKRLKDALDLYAQDAKDRADIEANARQLIRDEKNKEYADDVKFYEALSTLSHEQKQNELQAEYEFYKNLSDQDKKAVEQRKANQQQLQQFLVSSLTQIASQINQNIQARRQAEISNIQLTEQADLDSLDRRAAAENLTATQIAAQRKIIQEKALKEQKQAQAKAAKANKDLAYFNIAINTAQAITKQIATTPYPAALPFLALIAAEAAVQVGLVASRPIPAFAKGVVDYNGKGTGTSDSNIVAISRGESIIKASETARYKEELEMMNKGKFADFVYKKYITPAIVSDSITDARNKGMAQNIATSLQVNELNTDHLERAIKGNKKVKIENLGELAAIMQRQDHFTKYKF